MFVFKNDWWTIIKQHLKTKKAAASPVNMDAAAFRTKRITRVGGRDLTKIQMPKS